MHGSLPRHSFLSAGTEKRAEATKQMMGWIAAGAVQAMQLVGGGGTAEQRCTGGD